MRLSEWLASQGIYETKTSPEDHASNGAAEVTVTLPSSLWPLAVRQASEQTWRRVLSRLGAPSRPLLAFGTRVQAKNREWKRRDDKTWGARTVPGVIVGPAPQTLSAYVVRLMDGKLYISSSVHPVPAVAAPKPRQRHSHKSPLGAIRALLTPDGGECHHDVVCGENFQFLPNCKGDGCQAQTLLAADSSSFQTQEILAAKVSDSQAQVQPAAGVEDLRAQMILAAETEGRQAQCCLAAESNLAACAQATGADQVAKVAPTGADQVAKVAPPDASQVAQFAQTLAKVALQVPVTLHRLHRLQVPTRLPRLCLTPQRAQCLLSRERREGGGRRGEARGRGRGEGKEGERSGGRGGGRRGQERRGERERRMEEETWGVKSYRFLYMHLPVINAPRSAFKTDPPFFL